MACHAYVFPCVWEDHCKIGFSHDPLARIAQLHPRWFEFFDLEQGLLVEAETERDTRDLELRLRRPLAVHRAPQPMAIRANAGGHTEWVRGALAELQESARVLGDSGYRVHAPASRWLATALLARREDLYERTTRLLAGEDLDRPCIATPARSAVRDALDAHVALGIAFEPCLPEAVLHWYQGSRA